MARPRRGVGAPLAVAWAALLPVSPLAQAHAGLVRAMPRANSTVGSAPLIRLDFSEALVARFSSLKLFQGDGRVVVTKSLPAASSELLSEPSARLRAGAYTVQWVAVAADDGHKTTGTLTFIVK